MPLLVYIRISRTTIFGHLIAMIQNWQKQGLIYSGRAQIPTVLELDSVWRIYFADRTIENKSFIRYIDVEKGNPKNILYEHKESLLLLGNHGTFDHDGIMPSWLLKKEDEIWLYYIGWSQRKDVPYQNAIGLAISQDNGKTFFKFNEAPILSTKYDEPYFTSTPCVLEIKGCYHLFYLSCDGWQGSEAKYNIKHRTGDGYDWSWPRVAIDYKSSDEGGICRPCIIDNKMWYCYRKNSDYRTNKNNSYRIGYAESKNFAMPWIRKDEEVGLNLSENGFDSEMLCYPFVLEYNNQYYIFYNGNGFGATGFGYATLDL